MSRTIYSPALTKTSNLSALSLLDNLKTVDGAGSGLDADTIKGQLAVQQGAGPSQLTTPDISIGWDGTKVRLSKGGVDLGTIATGADLSDITITGAFLENDATVAVDHTITVGKNAVSAGPISVAPTATVTVPVGSVWTIV